MHFKKAGQVDGIRLSEDSYIPQTTQRIDYRNPTFFNKNALRQPADRIIRPTSNLGTYNILTLKAICISFFLGEQQIMKIGDDESTYQAEISKLGGYIVEKQLHGKIIYPKCMCLQNLQN